MITMKIKLFCWLTAALAFCGMMTFSACSEPDDSQNHVVKPAYLEKIATVHPDQTGNPNVVITLYNTWEQGRLVKQQQETKIYAAGDPVTSMTTVSFLYTDGRCTEIKSEKSVSTFKYDDEGRIISGVKRADNGDTETATVKSYSPEGYILQMEETTVTQSTTMRYSYDLTWKNGDLVKYTIHSIEPAHEDETVVKTFDSCPSAFMGYPLAQSFMDGPYGMAERASRHNSIVAGDEYVYENGRLKTHKAKQNVEQFSYSDGTGKDQ